MALPPARQRSASPVASVDKPAPCTVPPFTRPAVKAPAPLSDTVVELLALTWRSKRTDVPVSVPKATRVGVADCASETDCDSAMVVELAPLGRTT